MAIDGYLITDKDIGAPWIKESLDGVAEGYKGFHVNTHDEAAALQAGVADGVGTAYSNLFPKLICRERRTEYVGGTDNDPGTGGGWTLVRCSYSTKEVTVLPPQVPDTKWTESDFDIDQVTIYHAIDAEPGKENAKMIRNGKGAGREVTRQTIKVHRFVDKNEVGLFDDLKYRNTVNEAEVILPAMLGSSTTHKAAPGTLLYRCMKVIVRDKVDELVFELAYSTDHLEHWRVEGEDGQAEGPEQQSRLYFEEDFSGLW